MKRYIKNDKIKFKNEIVICRDGVQIVNPTDEILLADGWSEYVLPEIEPLTPSYEERVELLIREKYSINQELAIQRQRETKPEEFAEYFSYCEECKSIARKEL